MKRILVSLVSEHTIPNILMACHYVPDVYWFVSTKKMEGQKKTECIERTLRLKGLLTDKTETKIVDQDSFADCLRALETLIDGVGEDVEYVVNITGGNKVMALAAYELFRDLGQKVAINYIPLKRNDFIQVFPRKRPLKVCGLSTRLTVEEYLTSYGFSVSSPANLAKQRERASLREGDAGWVMGHYEELAAMLSFLYEELKNQRGRHHSTLEAQHGRDLYPRETEFLHRFNFRIESNRIKGNLDKDLARFLTGDWLEDYVFGEVEKLVKEGFLDDASVRLSVKSLSGSENELDVAFTKDNFFYHIECKTLTESAGSAIVKEEVYKKGALSSLLGKGEKRGFICTTIPAVNDDLRRRADDHSLEVLSLGDVRQLKMVLQERLGQNDAEN